MKPIKIIFRKLGKHHAEGLAWTEDNLIELDSRLKGFKLLEAALHEIEHCQNPTWSELKVEGHSKQKAQLLWEMGFRRMEL